MLQVYSIGICVFFIVSVDYKRVFGVHMIIWVFPKLAFGIETSQWVFSMRHDMLNLSECSVLFWSLQCLSFWVVLPLCMYCWSSYIMIVLLLEALLICFMALFSSS